ncbi:nicotinate-nucleotide--dimethylbenzimidazole phosphoribosyltransferase [Pseudaeromonas sp. ZJS20]|uniref:nicotinate-nucleotide--dimethylbenzimidazole phosphoribosyltransferase n=1 Tax=Pseudaeromonas aegiceratis TaxID=3153928 RepID=UPI00390CA090
MQTLEQLIDSIRPLDAEAQRLAQAKVDALVKPIGSLGSLESLVVQLAGIYRTPEPSLGPKQILVMAADHGVFDEDIAVTPKEVTVIQALNMTRGKTGVCALAHAAGVAVKIVDIGIDCEPLPGVINIKLARGCGNIARGPAMRREDAVELLLRSARLAMQAVADGVRVLGVGELGIGNTTPAAAMVSVFTGVPAEEAVGLGANYPSDRLHHKVAVVEQAIKTNRPDAADPLDVLAKVGGFDLVGMTGVMLGGAAAGVPVVLDGFLSYACALAACKLAPQLWHYLIPSHLSAEKGSLLALAHLDFHPFLQLGMRLGEGSGAALAMPILEAAISMYQRMGLLSDVNLDLPAPV